MKRSNLITLFSIIILIVAALLFMFLRKAPAEKPSADSGANAAQTAQNDTSSDGASDSVTDGGKVPDTTAPVTSPAADSGAVTTGNTGNAPSEPSSMENSLFIGDSRTVGLMEYAGLDGANFFADTGMSVYNIHKKTLSVPSVGKVTLDELLTGKTYSKIYVMLGVNEIGYDIGKTAEKYGELLLYIKERQPEAVLFIQANLHVSKERSDSDSVTNNYAIDRLNGELAKLADNKGVFYLDVNPVFDDENGNLSADKTGDSAHLYAKYYAEWGKWIAEQTSALIKEG